MLRPPTLILFALLAALTVAGRSRAQELAPASGDKIYHRGVHSTAWVLALNKQGTGARSTGSGSLVDATRRLVLTSDHVMTEGDQALVIFPAFEKGEPVPEREYYTDGRGRSRAVRGRVIARDPKHDLALIQVASIPEGVTPLHLARRPVAPGQNVHSIGSPGATNALWVYTPGKVRQVYQSEWSAQVGREMRTFAAKVILTDSAVNSGDSGGPLLNDAGELIGVAHGHQARPDGAFRLTTFIHYQEIANLLASQGVRTIPTSARPRAGEGARDAGAHGDGDHADSAHGEGTHPEGQAAPSDHSERTAAAKLKLAKQLAQDGLTAKARIRYQEIIKEFPTTKAAAQAKELLDKLGPEP